MYIPPHLQNSGSHPVNSDRAKLVHNYLGVRRYYSMGLGEGQAIILF